MIKTQENPTVKFALTGAAGFVASRHLKAIHDTGSELQVCMDLHDSVGLIDNYFPKAIFFKDQNLFWEYISARNVTDSAHRIDYVSICTPNDLHMTQIKQTLNCRANAICEKPLAIDPGELEALKKHEISTGKRVFTILQLRLHPTVAALKASQLAYSNSRKPSVDIIYITRRGDWYHKSWKGDHKRSGGLAMNIGVHFFDILLWVFGSTLHSNVIFSTHTKIAGELELEQAFVRWYLSIDGNDLPSIYRQQGKHALRSIRVSDQELDFSTGFTELHSKSYAEIMNGGGVGIDDALPSLELVHSIRNSKPARSEPVLFTDLWK